MPVAEVLLQAGFQGVLVSIVAVYAFTRSAELLGPVAGTSLPALIPVATLALESAVLRQAPPPGEACAAGLVAFGIGAILAGRHADGLLHRSARCGSAEEAGDRGGDRAGAFHRRQVRPVDPAEPRPGDSGCQGCGG